MHLPLVKINGAQPNEHDKAMCFQVLLLQSQAPSPVFGRDSEAGREVGTLSRRKAGKDTGVLWLQTLSVEQLPADQLRRR